MKKKLILDIEAKNVGESDVDPSEKERELKCNDLICSVPADLSVESDSSFNEVVSPSTVNEDNETLSDIETDKDEVKIKSVPPEPSTSQVKKIKLAMLIITNA